MNKEDQEFIQECIERRVESQERRIKKMIEEQESKEDKEQEQKFQNLFEELPADQRKVLEDQMTALICRMSREQIEWYKLGFQDAKKLQKLVNG